MIQIYVQVLLWCPDGLPESCGFDIPNELDKFLKFVNNFSGKKGYRIEAKITSTLELMAKLKSDLKRKGR